MTAPASPEEPPASAPRRRGVVVAICLLLGLGLVAACILVVRSLSAREQAGDEPRGVVRLPPHCDILPPAAAAKLRPGGGEGRDERGVDGRAGLYRACTWGVADMAGGEGRGLHVTVTAYLDPDQDGRVPDTDHARAAVAYRIPGDPEPRTVQIAGADEAYLFPPNRSGQAVRARFQNVEVIFGCMPDAPIDPAELERLVMSGTEEVLRTVRGG